MQPKKEKEGETPDDDGLEIAGSGCADQASEPRHAEKKGKDVHLRTLSLIEN